MNAYLGWAGWLPNLPTFGAGKKSAKVSFILILITPPRGDCARRVCVCLTEVGRNMKPALSHSSPGQKHKAGALMSQKGHGLVLHPCTKTTTTRTINKNRAVVTCHALLYKFPNQSSLKSCAFTIYTYISLPTSFMIHLARTWIHNW